MRESAAKSANSCLKCWLLTRDFLSPSAYLMNSSFFPPIARLESSFPLSPETMVSKTCFIAGKSSKPCLSEMR